MSFLFKKLLVYQESSSFAHDILAVTSDVSRRHNSLADQLRRAAMSIPANIAEGWARWHPKEKRQFYRVALGSAYECIPHLEFALFEKIISQEKFDHLMLRLDRIARLLNGLTQSVK